jgi:hypothetical protein
MGVVAGYSYGSWKLINGVGWLVFVSIFIVLETTCGS